VPAAAIELAGHDAGNGRRFVTRRLRGQTHGARFDTIDHHQAEPEGERAHDHREREEDLHANRHASRARAHEPRHNEGDEQNQQNGAGGDRYQPCHGVSGASRSTPMR
jgi:hypothetical protein